MDIFVTFFTYVGLWILAVLIIAVPIKVLIKIFKK